MSRFGDMIRGNSAPAPEPVAPTPDAPTPPAPAVVEEPSVEETEADDVEVALEPDLSLYDMSKRELEAYGRTIGIELDKRHSKSRLIDELKSHLDNN